MPFHTPHTQPQPARNLLKAGLLTLALIATLAATAQTTPAQNQLPKAELSDPISAKMQDIIKLFQGDPATNLAPNYIATINAVNALLPTVSPESYDTFYLSQLKAQACLMSNDVAGATRPLETMLQLVQRYPNFDGKDHRTRNMTLELLAKIYTQDAANEKNPEIQKQKYNKALAMLRQWIAVVPKPDAATYSLIATILYQQATASNDSKRYDQALLKQAETECNNALAAIVKPPDTTYQLMVAIAQAQNDFNKAARYLEIMVQTNPKNSSYWNQLMNSYLSAIDATPPGSFLRNEAYAKAVYTVTRAQQNGFMQNPSDYYNKAALYIQSEQLEGAVDLLESGLRSGKIETTKYSNWELLATCYAELGDTQKAIDTYKAAMKFFPNDGNIDMQIGQVSFNKEDYRPALDAFLAATKKQIPPKKEVPLYAYIAYAYLYLKEYEKGMEFVTKALKISPDDQSSKGIQRALQEAIDMRDRALGVKKDQDAAQNQPQQPQQTQQPQTQQPPPAAAPATAQPAAH